jgi:hypothetical protein
MSASDLNAKIVSFADAHRRAMEEGDSPAVPTAEKAILLALVASSVAETASWISTRKEGGDARAAMLSHLAAELEAHNFVGKGLRTVERDLAAQARKATLAAVSAGAAPAWLATTAALCGGAIGFLTHFGNAIGSGVVIGLFCVTVVAGISPPFRVAVLRVLAQTPGVIGSTGKGVANAGAGAVGLFVAAGSIGKQAESILRRNAAGEIAALRGPQFLPQVLTRTLAPLRALAQLAVGGTLVALVGALVVLVFGIKHGFAQQAEECEENYAPESDCGLKPT